MFIFEDSRYMSIGPLPPMDSPDLEPLFGWSELSSTDMAASFNFALARIDNPACDDGTEEF